MFYSETILSRRGPLGKVWLAAHMERKLSKTQTLQTNIEQSVDAIMGQEVEVMALRLSGQLLLGVVRIYSRKAKYLLDDCNEALLKIKMAFRPGIVDMTEDQLVVNKTAITLQANGLDLDLLLPDVNWDLDFEDRPRFPHGHHQAHVDDITLRTVDDFQQFDINDPFEIGPVDGIGSQDYNDVDLGIHWDDEPVNENEAGNESDRMSVDGSVGVGRNVQPRRSSIDSQLLRIQGTKLDMPSPRSKSRQLSENPFSDVNMDLPDFGGVDLADFDIGFDEPRVNEDLITPGQTRSSSRASSPLTELPLTPPPEGFLLSGNMEDKQKSKRKPKERKQIIDSVTELHEGPGAKVGRGRDGGLGVPMTQDVGDILTDQHFLPRSSLVMRLLEIRDDPLAHFLPTKSTDSGTFFCVAPPGLTTELAELFMRPVRSSSNKRRGLSQDVTANKRPRLGETSPNEEIEVGRRADSIAASVIGSETIGRASMGPDAGFNFEQPGVIDDYQLPEFVEGDTAHGLGRIHSVDPTDRSHFSTPGPDGVIEDVEDSYADALCPIASFDARPSQTLPSGLDGQPDPSDQTNGYSKNTVKALGLLRRELQPEVDSENMEPLSFRKLSDKASRRAAASFFFEMLVLGTRDCIQLKQASPFENIEILAKAKLWEQQSHNWASPTKPSTLRKLSVTS